MNERRKSEDPLAGPIGAIFKFFGAALFGFFVAITALVLVGYLGEGALFTKSTLHLLWIIPLIWGTLGIFWFEQMLEFGRRIVEAFFSR